MRAAYYDQFGPPEVMHVGDLPAPELAPGGVLIDVVAASVVPGDWKLRAGELQQIFDVTFPKVPGRDGAGVVRAVADDVTGLRPGDPVCFVSVHTEQGSSAERICRPAGDVVPMPPGLSFAQGAAMMHAGVCAWICIGEAGGGGAEIGPGTRVLIHSGAGAIGGAAIQIARHLGAEVTTTCSHRNLGHVGELGAHRAIAYDREDFASEDGGYDLVLDLVGGEVHRRSYDVLAPGGTMVYLLADPIEDLSAERGVTTVLAPIREDRAVHDKVVELVRSGVIRPQISRVFPLDEIAEAHRMLAAGEVSRGRLVIDIAGADRIPAPE